MSQMPQIINSNNPNFYFTSKDISEQLIDHLSYTIESLGHDWGGGGEASNYGRLAHAGTMETYCEKTPVNWNDPSNAKIN